MEICVATCTDMCTNTCTHVVKSVYQPVYETVYGNVYDIYIHTCVDYSIGMCTGMFIATCRHMDLNVRMATCISMTSRHMCGYVCRYVCEHVCALKRVYRAITATSTVTTLATIRRAQGAMFVKKSISILLLLLSNCRRTGWSRGSMLPRRGSIG